MFWAVIVYFLFMFNKNEKDIIITISSCHYQNWDFAITLKP